MTAPLITEIFGGGRLILASLVLAVFGAGGPVRAETPQIELPSPLSESPAETLAETPAETLPANQTEAPDDGIIRLPAPVQTEAEAEIPEDAPGEEAAIAQIPVDRDRSAGSATASTGWLIRPRPATLLPDGVQVGASLTAPGTIRLTGETAGVDLRLDLPAGTVLPETLQLTLHSSVNVLPDQAMMQIVVNDADPVGIRLDQLWDFTGVTVETAALIPGSNRIRLSLQQPHRIFCGPEATFGVWTEIDLTNSGVLIDDSALPADAAGFALAVQSETAGGRNLLLLADEATDPALIRSLSEQLERALGPGGGVAQASFYSLEPREIASVALIPSDRPNALVRRGAGRGLVLQVEYQDGTLPDLTPFLAAFPPALPESAPAIRPGEKTLLSDLGIADVVGNTHYFRRDLPFSLPADWLLMANQKARLDLHYGFARNLPQGAILLVKVNDETIRLLPLDQNGGEVLPVLPVSFNANLLHPGRNTLSFEMMVPGNPPDGACPVRRADLLALLNDSSLTIPPSPSMVLPGLAAVLLRLDPSGVIAPEGAIEYKKLAQDAMRIAAELAPATEISATVRLQVVGLSDFGLVPFEKTDLSLNTVQRVLFPLNDPPQMAAEPAPGGTPATSGRATSTAAFTLVEDADPEAPGQPEDPAAVGGFVRDLWQSFSPYALLAHEYRLLRESSFVGTSQSLPDWLEGRRGQALLLRPDFTERGELWLMLGPGVAPEAIGEALNRLRVASMAQGEAALLQADGSWQVWTPIRPPRMLTVPDAGGMRTALGNYASWSPLLFTLAMLGLTLLSAIPALLYVLLSRRGREER